MSNKTPSPVLASIYKRAVASGGVGWSDLISATSMNLKNLGRWTGYKDGICVRFACGECRSPGCTAAHLEHQDCPRDWVNKAAEALKAAEENLTGEGKGAGG